VSATARLLEFAAAALTLPPQVAADAERLLADTLAVGAAGASAPGGAEVLKAARGWGEGRAARVLGATELLPQVSAAFVNAFRIHCLEWDAVHEPAVVHALSVVTAALGAAIDARGGCDRREALAALAVGVEIAAGLGDAAASPLRFFRPATAGCLGAALAVARVAGVQPSRFADVLGLAYSQCAGTMQAHVEGSIALPLQIGLAARAAVSAVDLVQAGLTGPHDVIEGPYGYFRLFDEGDPTALTAALGERWRLSEVSTKPFPSGRASHGVLGALRELRREGLAVAEIERIEALVPPLVARLVGRPFRADMSPASARLCLQLLAALMLTDGLIDPRRFIPSTFADRAIAGLAARVDVSVDPNRDPNALSPQRLIVRRTSGLTIERAIPASVGSPCAPMPPDLVAEKLALARALAPLETCPDIFTDASGYFIRGR